MLLNELLKAIQPVQIAGDSNIEIAGINIDSRLVEAGQLLDRKSTRLNSSHRT